MLYRKICGGNRRERREAAFASVIEDILGDIIRCPSEKRRLRSP